jgi:hypothetical protein
MIIILPIIWVVVWLFAGLFVGAYSGWSAHGAGLELFLAIFLGGGFVLPTVGGAAFFFWRRLKKR